MDYMVNKGKWVNIKGKCYAYGDDLPDDAKIPQDWIDQRVVIIKKKIKEQKIKEKKNLEGGNK